MLRFGRRELLIGATSGATGIVSGMAVYRYLRRLIRADNLFDIFPAGATPSYAHSGEDVIAQKFLMESPLGRVTGSNPSGTKSTNNHNSKPTYLDIGAADPVRGNNSYLFYVLGCRGALVEPNIDFVQEIKAKRPEDTVLNLGIGVTEEKEADYYCYTLNPAWNTFDKELAEARIAKSKNNYDKIIKMPLVPINRVIEENFHGKAPDFLSTDVEGLDLAILKSLDFQRFRPKVICAETIAEDLTHALQTMNPEITAFLAEKGYDARGMTYYNTLYIDRNMVS